MNATPTAPTALELRDRVSEAKMLYQRGAARIEYMYAAADAYIECLKAAKREGRFRGRVPNRAYVCRLF